MKNNGFTLIELLAVIVILAIISLIATPIILNIINDAKIESTKRSAENYVKAVETEVVRKNLTSEFNPSTCTIVGDNLNCDGYTDPITVEIDGEKPTNGTITFENNKAKTYTLGYVGKTVTKAEDGKVTVSDTSENEPEEEPAVGSMCVPATNETKTTGNVPTGTYEQGDEYICKLKSNIDYHFFVLSESDNEVNLIMDSNIASNGDPIKNVTSDKGLVAWLVEADYPNGGVEENYYGDPTFDHVIPYTAITYLNNAISNWSRRIEKIELPKRTDLSVVCSDKCPLWLVNYLIDDIYHYAGRTSIPGIYGYWTNENYMSTTTSLYLDNIGEVRYYTEEPNYSYYGDINSNQYFGVRPVITVLKAEIG